MVSFEVYVNGEKRYAAGVGDHGVLIASLIWASHEPERLAQWKEQGISDLTPIELYANVSGMWAGEHLKWRNLDLSIGDEIRIRVIESTMSDPPETRYHPDPFADLARKKEYVLNMAKELGWELRTDETMTG